MGLLLLEAPAAPLVSLEDAQVHLRAENPEEAALVQSLALAATGQAEAFCRRRFLTQRWRLTLDAFPGGAIVLQYPPLQSVEAVRYLDLDGILQTVPAEDYQVRAAEVPGEVVPAYGKAWPFQLATEDAVRVEYTCGYGDPEDVPEAIRAAVLLIVGTLYANRETVAPVAMQPIPHSAEWLLGPYRVLRW
ncbi:MAG: head-tail connector protein [Planctomycetes bacterium]|nr:head-tail connector protein [Planctomycetota bacterium]MCK6530869.1 head-tail connector protein [Myxococcota bacterium]